MVLKKFAILSSVLLLVVIRPVGADVLSEVTFTDLFRDGTGNFSLSPDGQFVAYQENQRVFAGNAEVGFALVYGFSEHMSLQEIDWVGSDTLVIRTRNKISGIEQLRATKMGIQENGEFGPIAYRRHEIEGYIHHRLQDEPDYIEFMRVQGDDDTRKFELFRFNVFQKTSRNFRKRQRIDTGSTEFYRYLADSNDNFPFAMRADDDISELWRQSPDGKSWSRLWASLKGVKFHPFGLSPDGQSMWVLTNAFTDKVAAVEFDLINGGLKSVLFEHERVDLFDLVLPHDSGPPLGVAYREHGMDQYRFFAEDARKSFEKLRAKFPDKRVNVVGQSDDGSVVLIATSTSRDRGQIRHCDIQEDRCEMVISIAPWLDNMPLNETIVMDVPSSEGISVEAFLTLPASSGDTIPLIAMPHGGPIGVTDSRYFSPDVQWLAHNGYAVLQINYRGSGGYGRKFEDAGLKQWGRGIEDDIESAVKLALLEYPQLDGSRVGIFGGSYGGYSALMSAIRNPDLFVCAASYAGVTDLTLIFTQAKMHNRESLRETMIEIIGSPIQDYEEQRANSPAYRYKDITRPVFLAHGTDDYIVDIEHSWRLRKLMQLNGTDPEFIILDNVRHSFANPGEAEALYVPLLAFLDKHLKP